MLYSNTVLGGLSARARCRSASALYVLILLLLAARTFKSFKKIGLKTFLICQIRQGEIEKNLGSKIVCKSKAVKWFLGDQLKKYQPVSQRLNR